MTGPSVVASGASRARFPRLKRLADFDVSANPIDAATISTLASGAYLDKGEPVVLLGDSGTGKSHLLIGMGMAACEQGRAVRYATCAGLVNELVEAADERRLSRWSLAMGVSTCCCSTSWATSSSTPAAPSCSSRS